MSDVPYVVYTPYSNRTVDTQFKELVRSILKHHKRVPTQMEQHALRYDGKHKTYLLTFDLRNGAPVITERDLISPFPSGRNYFGQAVAEIIGFLNGALTHEDLVYYGCHWWKPWVKDRKTSKRGLPKHHLGWGSYGNSWTDFPTRDGSGFNQIDAVIAQIRQNPHLRTHRITAWYPPSIFRADGYSQSVVVVPCHGDVFISIDIEDQTISIQHVQRSADVLVGLPANLIGYTAFALMLAQVTGYTARAIEFALIDAHIYESQIPYAEAILDLEDRALPTMLINEAKAKIQDYRMENFVLEDYHPTGGNSRIPTPV